MNTTLQAKTVNSCIAAESIGELIAAEYDLGGPIASRLMMAYMNDHYLITVGNSKYVARVYFCDQLLQTNKSHYCFELELLTYLFNAGCPVAHPIQRRDGNYLGRIDAPEGVRYIALFTFAKGKISVPMSKEQSYIHGATIAQIHLASNGYKSPHPRYSSDLDFLLDEPIQRLREYWGESIPDIEFVVELASHLKEKVLALLGNSDIPDAWHVIGGDFGGLHLFFNEENQPTYFKFDSCSYGWRAYDLAIFLLETALMDAAPEISASFLAGYQSVRPLSEAELDSLLPFMLIQQIWIMGTSILLTNISGESWLKNFYKQNLEALKMLFGYYQASSS